MRRSFIVPRRKSVITAQLRLVFFFFAITLVMLTSTYAFLSYKTSDFSQKKAHSQQSIIDVNDALKRFDYEIKFIDRQFTQAEQIYTSNTVLKESIKNLFDLVPNRITLAQAKLDSHSLILYGTTPNKDVYEFMLNAPLRSIFHRTYSSFYPLDNGWYRFVSTNYLDEEEL
ncbi:MAG: hypothetical protein U9R50_05780 [Campylobacterota bacterium]|nr:hypothetical protein [Campylobacterota bacterium]